MFFWVFTLVYIGNAGYSEFFHLSQGANFAMHLFMVLAARLCQ
jgi:hypothetical protein